MKFIPSLLAVGSLSGAAYAATIVQTESFMFVPSGSQALTFEKFDTQGGTRTLNSVTVSVVLNKTDGRFRIDNDSAEGGTITLEQRIVGMLTPDGVSLRKMDGTFVGQNGRITAISSLSTTIAANDGDDIDTFDTGGADYVDFSPIDTSASDSGMIHSDDRAGYIASGPTTNFFITFDANQFTQVTGVGGLQQLINPSNAAGTITVTYDFVPEPSTALLCGVGLLVILRRRRG